MDRGFIPADKVLSEMRRVAMADFMRWWRSDERRDAIGDLIFWTEIDEIARRCRGEGERKRYRFTDSMLIQFSDSITIKD